MPMGPSNVSCHHRQDISKLIYDSMFVALFVTKIAHCPPITILQREARSLAWPRFLKSGQILHKQWTMRNFGSQWRDDLASIMPWKTLKDNGGEKRLADLMGLGERSTYWESHPGRLFSTSSH